MKIVITKKYGDRTIFAGQEFVLDKGKITCLLGESGVGKTTLLRALCGLEKFDGEMDEVASVSVAFQEPRLLPFASCISNLTFVDVEEEKAKEWLSWAELGDGKQLVSTLSGGEKQRLSLVRALAKESELLLLDEPFSSVDTARKVRLLAKLRALLEKGDRTCLFVTHDVDEAAFVADKILLVKAGKVESFEVDARAEYGASTLREKIYRRILSED